MAKDTDIPIDLLRQCFDHDAETGVLTWRERPREHFTTTKAWATSNARCTGTVAGSSEGGGYLRVRLTFAGRQRSLKVHRIVWALTHGCWPAHEVDHEKGVRDANGLGNLRPATHAENQQNKKIYRNNTSALTGVSWHKPTRKWQAAIQAVGRRIYLGLFDSEEEAYMAYLDAKARLHPFQPVPRDLNEVQAYLEARAWFRRRAWREIV